MSSMFVLSQTGCVRLKHSWSAGYEPFYWQRVPRYSIRNRFDGLALSCMEKHHGKWVAWNPSSTLRYKVWLIDCRWLGGPGFLGLDGCLVLVVGYCNIECENCDGFKNHSNHFVTTVLRNLSREAVRAPVVLSGGCGLESHHALRTASGKRLLCFDVCTPPLAPLPCPSLTWLQTRQRPQNMVAGLDPSFIYATKCLRIRGATFSFDKSVHLATQQNGLRTKRIFNWICGL